MDQKLVDLTRKKEDAKRHYDNWKRAARVAISLNVFFFGLLTVSVLWTFLVDYGYGEVWVNILLTVFFLLSTVWTLFVFYGSIEDRHDLEDAVIAAGREYDDYILNTGQ